MREHEKQKYKVNTIQCITLDIHVHVFPDGEIHIEFKSDPPDLILKHLLIYSPNVFIIFLS